MSALYRLGLEKDPITALRDLFLSFAPLTPYADELVWPLLETANSLAGAANSARFCETDAN